MSNGHKGPFLQPPNPNTANGNDRHSLSRASSRSMSMHSNGQVYDRPPSSFDTLQGSLDGGFEAQVKASPFINDLLDRLLRCEYSTKEIQRELSEVTRKLAIVERALSADIGRGGQGQPTAAINEETRLLNQRVNALTTSVSQLLALQTQTHMQNLNLGGHSNGTGSMGPNSANNALNSLNSLPSNPLSGMNGPNPQGNVHSLGGGPLGNLSINTAVGLNNLNGNNGMNMQTSAGAHGPTSANSLNNNQMHVLPNRPDVGLGLPNQRNNSIRGGNGIGPLGGPVQRTWSVGNADMMPRRDSDAGIGLNGGAAGANGMNALLRDKRKMSLGLARRESTTSVSVLPFHSVSSPLNLMGPVQTIGDDSAFAGRERDNGAVVSKWEHLPLMPELLRSINKYG